MLRRLFSVVVVLLFMVMVVVGIFTAQAVKASGRKVENDRGRQLFMTYCASCHGEDAKGNGPAAPALKTAPANLTAIAKVNGKFPGLRVRRIIGGDDFISGHGSREMPIWGDIFRKQRDTTISKANVYALTKYVESIQAR
ncbi:MAG: cytochrome c [Blastocatellia bacterium]|nr:cytochrome c [Blastocatellia bacterium]